MIPGLTAAAVADVAERVRAELPGDEQVAFAGCLFMPEDEVLLCLFAGSADVIRAITERVGLRVERVLVCAGIGWRTCNQQLIQPG